MKARELSSNTQSLQGSTHWKVVAHESKREKESGSYRQVQHFAVAGSRQGQNKTINFSQWTSCVATCELPIEQATPVRYVVQEPMSARVGILGAGQARARQASGFSACSDAKIAGIADLDEKRASHLASEYKAAAFRNLPAFLSPRLDILVVATPHNAHVASAEAAAALHPFQRQAADLLAAISDDRPQA